jgi:hypothetical protein
LLRSIGAGDAWLETGEPRCGRSFNVAICAAKFYKKSSDAVWHSGASESRSRGLKLCPAAG